jgi:hypothetical protein
MVCIILIFQLNNGLNFLFSEVLLKFTEKSQYILQVFDFIFGVTYIKEKYMLVFHFIFDFLWRAICSSVSSVAF